MKTNFFSLIFIVFFCSCNDTFTDDFFEFLFNSKDINISGQCSDRPPLFGEGRFFEIYSMEKVDIQSTKKNIFNKSYVKGSIKYPMYKIPEWKETPVPNEFDTIYLFIENEMQEEENTCFNAGTLKDVLKKKGNFYTFLYDNLGRKKMFIWDIQDKKLYLLSSYEL